VRISSGRRTALVHEAAGEALRTLLLTTHHGDAQDGVILAGGRGGTYRIRLDDGEVVVLRFYRRGGLVAHFLRDTYWGWPPRPFVELAATAEARRRGVPVPEVLGARVDRLWNCSYRGALVTRHLPGTVTLWERFKGATDGEHRRRLSARAGYAVRTLCEAGIYHPDLNLNNCIVREKDGDIEVFVVDFDRARVRKTSLGSMLRRRTLRRVERSARKLDPDRRVLGSEELSALRDACWSS
jgi:3-deoxy-D-manno-octulosonic acid kinase